METVQPPKCWWSWVESLAMEMFDLYYHQFSPFCLQLRRLSTKSHLSCQKQSSLLAFRSHTFSDEWYDGSSSNDKASESEAYDCKDEKELEKLREILEFGENQTHHKHIAKSNLQIN